MAHSLLYPQCRSDNLHDSPARVVFFAHFINKDTRLREVKRCRLVSRWGGYDWTPSYLDSEALARTFSVDSRENASQEGGRKEDVLGRNKGPGPHPWALPGCPLSRRLSG